MHKGKEAIVGALSGVAGLWTVNLLAPYTGIELPIGMLSLVISAVGGLPGVALLLLLPLVL